MIKFIVRMTASSWILYSLLNLMGMSHGMSVSMAVSVWLLLLTLYDDVVVSKSSRKQVQTQRSGGISNGLQNASTNIRHSSR